MAVHAAGSKTNKSLTKRFKVTATKRLMHKAPGRSHLLGKMSKKSKRQLKLDREMSPSFVKKYRQMMCIG